MIYCFGESLYDIVFQGDQPSWAVPGGSMLNVAVSLGHSGENVQLLSESGNDKVASVINDFLKDNNVGTDYFRFYDNNSTLALAFLDKHGKAEYEFYFTQPEIAPVFQIPPFKSGDILMFGSIYSTLERNRTNIKMLAKAAKKEGVTIFYDPNFRPSHLPRLKSVMKYIKENIKLADIVRASDEDFKLICDAMSGEQAYSFVKESGANTLIYTKNIEGVILYNGNFIKSYKALPTEIISTIGAGDAFNAGVAAVIHQVGKMPKDDFEWDRAMNKGLAFASEVCSSKDNYISIRK